MFTKTHIDAAVGVGVAVTAKGSAYLLIQINDWLSIGANIVAIASGLAALWFYFKPKKKKTNDE